MKKFLIILLIILVAFGSSIFGAFAGVVLTTNYIRNQQSPSSALNETLNTPTPRSIEISNTEI